MSPQQVVTVLTILVTLGLLLAGMAVGWMMRGKELARVEGHHRDTSERWRSIYEQARQRSRQDLEDWAAERDGLQRELRDLLCERADLKFQLGTQRGQGRVGLLEDGPEEGWVLSDAHELEVQKERRREEEGSPVDSSVLNHLLDE